MNFRWRSWYWSKYINTKKYATRGNWFSVGAASFLYNNFTLLNLSNKRSEDLALSFKMSSAMALRSHEMVWGSIPAALWKPKLNFHRDFGSSIQTCFLYKALLDNCYFLFFINPLPTDHFPCKREFSNNCVFCKKRSFNIFIAFKQNNKFVRAKYWHQLCNSFIVWKKISGPDLSGLT